MGTYWISRKGGILEKGAYDLLYQLCSHLPQRNLFIEVITETIVNFRKLFLAEAIFNAGSLNLFNTEPTFRPTFDFWTFEVWHLLIYNLFGSFLIFGKNLRRKNNDDHYQKLFIPWQLTISLRKSLSYRKQPVDWFP